MTEESKHKYSKHLTFVAVLLVFFIGFLLYSFKDKNERIPVVHTVELSQNGFSPEEITISKGDTVRFISTRGVQFWPASNEHPVHSKYSEFDTKRPLESDENWEFTFAEQGTWEYRDHLYSFFEGTVVVQ